MAFCLAFLHLLVTDLIKSHILLNAEHKVYKQNFMDHMLHRSCATMFL